MNWAEIGDRIRQRLDGVGMKSNTLAKLLGVTPSMISKTLKGERSLGLFSLAKVARLLAVDLVELVEGPLQPDPVVEFYQNEKRTVLPEYLLPRARIYSLAEAELRDLLRRPAVDLKQFRPKGRLSRETGETAARNLRETMKLPEARMTSIEDLAEQLGVSLARVPSDAPGRFKAGAFRWSDDERIIVVRESMHPEDRRFAIAHELGHLILQDEPLDVISPDVFEKDPAEQAANAFAAELLVPRSGVNEFLPSRKLSENPDADPELLEKWRDHIHAARNYFGVSAILILWRFEHAFGFSQRRGHRHAKYIREHWTRDGLDPFFNSAPDLTLLLPEGYRPSRRFSDQVHLLSQNGVVGIVERDALLDRGIAA